MLQFKEYNSVKSGFRFIRFKTFKLSRFPNMKFPCRIMYNILCTYKYLEKHINNIY